MSQRKRSAGALMAGALLQALTPQGNQARGSTSAPTQRFLAALPPKIQSKLPSVRCLMFLSSRSLQIGDAGAVALARAASASASLQRLNLNANPAVGGVALAAFAKALPAAAGLRELCIAGRRQEDALALLLRAAAASRLTALDARGTPLGPQVGCTSASLCINLYLILYFNIIDLK